MEFGCDYVAVWISSPTTNYTQYVRVSSERGNAASPAPKSPQLGGGEEEGEEGGDGRREGMSEGR